MILNHTIEALLDRRSVRAYRPEQISEEELTDILQAAKFAPSTKGLQKRHFTVIQNKKLIAEIVETAKKNGASFTGAYSLLQRPDCYCALCTCGCRTRP